MLLIRCKCNKLINKSKQKPQQKFYFVIKCYLNALKNAKQCYVTYEVIVSI